MPPSLDCLPYSPPISHHYFIPIEKRTLYPEIEPYRTGYLQVGNGHTLYWEESGNPKGQPILYLHGGPGWQTNPNNRCYFDPQVYRIILFDQRGCGKSLPQGRLEHNTTWNLINDIEQLRLFLQVKKWMIFGGSWGSTLALAYAQTFPVSVKALILNGIFLCRPQELHWFYQTGANLLFPDAWEKFIAPIPENERTHLLLAYHKRLMASDEKTRKEAAFAWAAWEGSTVKLQFDPRVYTYFTEAKNADVLARLECHYFIHQAFFPTQNWLLENMAKISHIPGIIIHGRYDMLCPFENAWLLHKAWPKSKLVVIPDAGHSPAEPGSLDALIQATDEFRTLKD